jgi:hypothetical protein
MQNEGKNSTHIKAGKHSAHTQFFLFERAYGKRNTSIVYIDRGENMFEKRVKAQCNRR